MIYNEFKTQATIGQISIGRNKKEDWKKKAEKTETTNKSSPLTVIWIL